MDIGNIRGASQNYANNKTSRAATDEDIANMQKQHDRANLDMNDFLQLLAAQLRYQDMSSPMDNSQMMQQMTQMATVSAMTTMSDMMSAMGQVSTTTYAASMIGKELTVVKEIDKEGKPVTIKGLVTGMGFANNMPCVFIDGKGYGLGQIVSVGEVPEVKPDPPEEGEGDGSEDGDKGDGDKGDGKV